MQAVLSHWTALEYHRTHGTENRRAIPDETRTLAALAPLASGPRQLALLDIDLDGFARPLHLLVPNAASRSRSKAVQAHAWSGPLAHRSLFAAPGERFLVSSPEFTLLQLAGPPLPKASADDRLFFERLAPGDPLRPLDDPTRWAATVREVWLAQTAMELMGTYRRTEGTGTGTTYGEMPLTSYNALSHFADEQPSVRGIELFRATLGRSMPMSFSPMETMLALMLTLPTGLGGYGLPRPILNVRLRAGRAGISSQRTILPDLYWPEREVLLEYESFEFHEGSPGPLGANEKLAHDAERANTLLAMGMHPFVARPRQVLDLARLDLLAGQVAKRLGAPVTPCSGRSLERRAKLHALLSPHANDRA